MFAGSRPRSTRPTIPNAVHRVSLRHRAVLACRDRCTRGSSRRRKRVSAASSRTPEQQREKGQNQTSAVDVFNTEHERETFRKNSAHGKKCRARTSKCAPAILLVSGCSRSPRHYQSNTSDETGSVAVVVAARGHRTPRHQDTRGS